jgi:hypothetical protein
MKKCIVILIGAIFFYSFTQPAIAGEATPQEVVQKVQEAANYIVQKGNSVLDEFNDKTGRWVWGGTYVFVMKCSPFPSLATHPIKPGLIGKDLSGLKDKTGNYFFIQLCDAASKPKGGWVEYLWPKPGEKEPSRKISFCLAIPGSEYQVGAGIYDEDVSLEELEGMVK